MIKINQIKQWVKNIVLIVLFANFIEMLLPNSKFRGYIRVIIGFFVILVIIVPFIELLNFRGKNINLSLIKNEEQQELESILTTGHKLRQQDIESKKKAYKQKLTQQLAAVVKLNTQLKDPGIEIIFSNQNKIEKIIIDTKDNQITPVQVDLNHKEEKKDQLQQHQHLKKLLINLYGFDKEQIEVR